MQISTQHLPPAAGWKATTLPDGSDFLNALAAPTASAGSQLLQSPQAGQAAEQPDELKGAFHDFVGQTFFGEMIKSFRSTQQPSKYFHGGRAEEIFQGQFDQVLTEKLSDASAAKIADPMYELFMLKRAN